MESSIFWDITPCNSLEFNESFGGAYSLHVPPKRPLTFDLRVLQDVIFQKIEIRITAYQSLKSQCDIVESWVMGIKSMVLPKIRT
jgi:hypothetical protein